MTFYEPDTMYKCKHRHIDNDQRPRCYHDDIMGTEFCISGSRCLSVFPEICPLKKERQI